MKCEPCRGRYAEYGFVFALFGGILRYFRVILRSLGYFCAEGGISMKAKYAGDGQKRGSRLTSLVVRRGYDRRYDQKYSFPIYIFLFLPSSIRIFCHSVTAPYGIVQGLLAPSTPARVQSTLDPFSCATLSNDCISWFGMAFYRIPLQIPLIMLALSGFCIIMESKERELL